MTKKTASDIKQEITDRIVTALQGDVLPWRKPWSSTGIGFAAAKNVKSGNIYQGTNFLLLALQQMDMGHESNQWGTYKQWQELGGHVSKGSKGTQIVFFKVVDRSIDRDHKNDDSSSNPLALSDGMGGKFAMLRQYTVFNLDQTNDFGTDAYDVDSDTLIDLRPVHVVPTVEDMTERYDLADTVVKGTGANITYAKQDRAYYTPAYDAITMPTADQFETTAGFYGTLFHELAHWTGSETRLDRNIKNSFGSDDYAMEELVAELSTAMTCALLQVPNKQDENVGPLVDSVSYLSHWIQQLKADSSMIMKVASASRKATDYILKPTQDVHGLLPEIAKPKPKDDLLDAASDAIAISNGIEAKLNAVHAQGVNEEISTAEWEARTLELEAQL